MAKALKTAALVVGVVALAATGIGAAASAGLIGTAAAAGAAASTATVFGVTAATFTAVGTIAGVAAAVASLGAAALTKAPAVSASGDQTKITFSKDQGIPYPLGRTQVAGWMIHRQTYDYGGSKNNTYQTLVGIWGGGGPIHRLESFKYDGNVVAFAGDQAVGTYGGSMWLRYQLGAAPAAAALTAADFYPYPAGWSASAKLSGMAAFAWTVKWDSAGKKFPSGLQEPGAILEGALVYDPRQDSTFPGGNGPCRALDETTYVWDGIDPNRPAGKNGALHALTWAIGRWQNARRVLGIGMTLAAIDVAAFVQAANVADANGWAVGGCVYSTDGKLDVLKKMLATCSAEPLQLGGMLSCRVDTPRVSLATITDADIIGAASVVATPTISERINGCIPSCRLEEQDWSIVPCAQVQVADYVAADRRARTKALTWELVQDAAQVAQLATYAICNAREFGPIVTPLKLRWIGYKPGDALTIASANLGQDSQLVVVDKRHLDPETGAVTLTSRSETTAKHDFALGRTASPPPTPSLQVIDKASLLVPGVDASWPAIADPDGTKPADNADVTSENISKDTAAVGGRTVAEVLGDLDLNGRNWFDLAQLASTRDGIMLARTTLDGKPIGTVLATFRSEQHDENEAFAETFALLGAKAANGQSWIINGSTVKVGPDEASAQTLQSLVTTLGSHSATINDFREILIDDTGVTARAVMALNVDGKMAGMVSTNTGTVSRLEMLFDSYRLLGPNGQALIYAENGVVKMPAVEVDTLKVNTAVRPVRVNASARVTSSSGYSPILATSIVMTTAGWVEADFLAKLDFASGGQSWSLRLFINGELAFSTSGANTQDSVPLMGSIACPAGTIPVSVQMLAHGSVGALDRLLRVKGYPYTE